MTKDNDDDEVVDLAGVGDEERRGFVLSQRRRAAGARVSEEQETGVRLSGDERITEKIEGFRDVYSFGIPCPEAF